MQPAVRPLDVCVHRPSRRRCLVVGVRPGGAVECVYDDDRRFVGRAWELVPYHAPEFEAAARGCLRGRRGTPVADHLRREQAHAAALRAAVAACRRAVGERADS